MNTPTDSNPEEDLSKPSLEDSLEDSLEYFLKQVTVSYLADELIIGSLIKEEDSNFPILSTPNKEEGFFWNMINRKKTK